MVDRYRSNAMIIRHRRKYPGTLPEFADSSEMLRDNWLLWKAMYSLIPEHVEQDITRLMTHINSKGRNV